MTPVDPLPQRQQQQLHARGLPKQGLPLELGPYRAGVRCAAHLPQYDAHKGIQWYSKHVDDGAAAVFGHVHAAHGHHAGPKRTWAMRGGFVCVRARARTRTLPQEKGIRCPCVTGEGVAGACAASGAHGKHAHKRSAASIQGAAAGAPLTDHDLKPAERQQLHSAGQADGHRSAAAATVPVRQNLLQRGGGAMAQQLSLQPFSKADKHRPRWVHALVRVPYAQPDRGRCGRSPLQLRPSQCETAQAQT